MLRSLLFVPADSQRKLTKAASSGADALILDLEDSVSLEKKESARAGAREFLSGAPNVDSQIYVRINPLDSGFALDDLVAVCVAGLEGIVVPKVNSRDDVHRLSCYLDALEVSVGIPASRLRIIPVATETPRAVLSLSSFSSGLPRLKAMTWGAEDLSAVLGATTNSLGKGRWTSVYESVRSQFLLAACAAGVPALDTLYADFRDADGLAENCRISRRDGFVGRIAIHPSQVPVINESYSPTSEELALAARIIAAFEYNPEAGVVGLDGVMYDAPHLQRARRLIATVRSGAE
ncbi:MAG: CoA ester lyase [Parvibaculaceae bacterium]